MSENAVREALAWMEERAENSTGFGHHCHAYEVAARKLREALEPHLCSEAECPYNGKPSTASCRCHSTVSRS